MAGVQLSVLFTHKFSKQTLVNVPVKSAPQPPKRATSLSCFFKYREEISFDPPPPPKKKYMVKIKGFTKTRSKHEGLTLTKRNDLVNYFGQVFAYCISTH